MNKHLITILKFAISFAIIGWLFYKALQGNTFSILAESKKEWWKLFAAFCVGFAAISLSFYRWYRLVRALDLPMKLIDAFRLGFIGFLFTFLTLGVIGGDAVKAIFIARQTPSHKTEAVTTVFIDRVIGLFALFIITATAWFLMPAPKGETPDGWYVVDFACKLSIVFVSAGLAAIFVLFAMPNLNKSKLFLQLHKIPKLGGIIKRGVDALLTYRKRPVELFISVVLSLLVHAGLTLCIFWVASGLSNDHPSLPQHFMIVPISMVANAVPLPGGIGAFEAVLDMLYNAAGVVNAPKTFGFVVALAFRLIQLIIASIGMSIYFAQKKQINELIEQADAEHIMDEE